MSLIKCKECGKEISDKAESCVNCGCPISKKKSDNNIRNNYLSIFIYVVLTSLILLVIFSNSIPSIVTRYSGNYSFKEFIEWINSSYLKRFEVTDLTIYGLTITLSIAFILMFFKISIAKIVYGILTVSSILSIIVLYFLGYKLHIGMFIILISLIIMLIYKNNIVIGELVKKDFWGSIWEKVISVRKVLNIDFIKKHSSKLAIGLGVIVIVIISYLFVFSNDKSNVTGGFLYVSEDDSLKFISSNMKKAVEISSNYKEDYVDVIASKNKRYFLYYKNNGLYLVDTYNRKFESKKIINNAEKAYFINNDKNIIILTEDGDLYSYNYKDRNRLEKDVTKIVSVAKDNVVYLKDETLYIRNVSSDNKKKISNSFSEYDYIVVSEDENRLLYAVDNDSKQDYYVYTISSGKNKKVLTNIDYLYDYTKNFDSFIYTVETGKKTVDADQLFTDNYKESDSQYVDRNYYWDYIYGDITYEKYLELSTTSSAVNRRNNIRELLEDGISLGNEYDVYYQSGNDKVKLASNITYLENADIENKQIFYSIKNIKKTKKIDINEIDYYSYDEFIDNYITIDLMYKKDGFDEEKITILESDAIYFYQESKNDFYYSIENDKKTELYYVKLASGKVKSNKLISSNLYNVSMSKYNEATVYLENHNEDKETVDLKIVKAGKIKDIAYDILDEGYFALYTIEDKYIQYYQGSTDELNDKEYYIYDGKSKKLFKDITYVLPVNHKYMYILKDCSTSSDSSTCDLYRYQNAKLNLIEYGITNISSIFVK